MASVSLLVIAKNEERHIAACLESLRWADEVVVVIDASSSDRTEEIARGYTQRVVRHAWVSFPNQRNFALSLASCDWAFFVDADERVTPKLAEEIRRRCSQESPTAAYWAPRRNIILGKWIRHSGWYPDYQLRLLRHDAACYDERREVHEVAMVDGPTERLEQPLIHINYETLGELLRKQLAYADYDARTLVSNGVRARPWAPVLQPLREFRRRYIDLQGYRDGPHGLLLALVMAWYQSVVYRKMRGMQKQKSLTNIG